MLALSIVAVPLVSAQGQRGPRIDMVSWQVVSNPVAQRKEMRKGFCDVWTSSIRQPWAFTEMYQALADGGMRPVDVEWLARKGFTVSGELAFHIGFFGFNMRNSPLDDVNFRHALAHLVPKEMISVTLFRYINIPISTPVPPAQGLWYNPHTDPHPYSRAEAEAILATAGYQKIGGEWIMPDGSSIRNLRLFCPTATDSPTSFTICTMFVAEANAIGLTSITMMPMTFSTYVDLVFETWDFDIFWGCWSLGRFPTHLYSFFHSSQLYLGSYNCYGINYPALDAEIETFYYGLDHPAKVAAAKKSQELLMGGRKITDELAKPAQAGREQAIPLIPVIGRNAYDAQHEKLRGAVNMYGYGINNMWTWMSIHWNTSGGFRPGTAAVQVWPILDYSPETLNPTSASTTYAWTFMDPVFDGLITPNPYTLRDMPWLATSWSYGVEAGGMYIKYNLRTTDYGGNTIMWQDGSPVSPSDVEFAWDFLADHEIPRYWNDMMYYLGSDISGNEITAHMSTTSQWLIYALAGTAYLLAPPVWTPWVGQPTNDILSWDPSAEAGPAGLPTKVYGTGPFILQHSTLEVANNGYGDLEANRDYWLETNDIIDIIAEMFHNAGDVDYLGEISTVAIQAINLAMWSWPGDPNWYENADVCGLAGGPPDGEVNIDDLAACGMHYGKTRYVPRE